MGDARSLCPLPGHLALQPSQVTKCSRGALPQTGGTEVCDCLNSYLSSCKRGPLLAAPWLGLHAFTTVGRGSDPGWGTEIPQALQCGRIKAIRHFSKGLGHCEPWQDKCVHGLWPWVSAPALCSACRSTVIRQTFLEAVALAGTWGRQVLRIVASLALWRGPGGPEAQAEARRVGAHPDGDAGLQSRGPGGQLCAWLMTEATWEVGAEWEKRDGCVRGSWRPEGEVLLGRRPPPSCQRTRALNRKQQGESHELGRPGVRAVPSPGAARMRRRDRCVCCRSFTHVRQSPCTLVRRSKQPLAAEVLQSAGGPGRVPGFLTDAAGDSPAALSAPWRALSGPPEPTC